MMTQESHSEHRLGVPNDEFLMQAIQTSNDNANFCRGKENQKAQQPRQKITSKNVTIDP
jgi:hypothetical protein